MTRVVVHIDRLVLSGFESASRDGIAEGLRTELTRLFAEPTALRQLGSIGNLERVRTAPVRLAGDATPRSSGESVARALHRGVSR